MNERLAAGSAYLCAVLPLWGILVAWVVRESWRERSRHVVFHTTQAIWLQVGLLLAFVGYVMLRMLCNVIYGMHPRLSEYLGTIGLGAFAVVSAVYGLTCLTVAWLTLDGRAVILPVIGPRIHAQEYEDGPSEP